MTQPPAWTTTPSRARGRVFLVLVTLLCAATVAVGVAPTFAGRHAVAAAPSGAPPSIVPAVTTGARDTRPTPSASEPSASAAGPKTKRPDPVSRLTRLGLPIFCGAGTQPLVALTFDDGPGILSADALKTLRAHHDTATFFLVGKLLRQQWLHGIVAKEVRLGAAFGDHTWDHVAVTGMSLRELHAQIARTRVAIRRQTHASVELFRPPLGLHDPRVDRYVRSEDMLQILWSIDTQDSQGASARRIFRNVKQNLSPGDIILMHDNRGTTEKALPRILNLIGRRGYATVTVPQLLAQDPPSDRQVRQRSCS